MRFVFIFGFWRHIFSFFHMAIALFASETMVGFGVLSAQTMDGYTGGKLQKSRSNAVRADRTQRAGTSMFLFVCVLELYI